MPPDFDLNDPDAVAYCPSCGSGYTARAIRCAPCDTALVPRAEVEAAHRLDAEQSDEGHSALLSRVDEPIKANRLELELNQAGIPYLVQAWPLETLDFAGAPRFLEFRVPAKRLGEAREALQRVEETGAGS